MKSIEVAEYPASPLTVQTHGISAIMPAYNTASEILRSLVKVEQTLSRITSDYEVIVVNDGSEDDTEQVVKSYLKLSPKVKLVSYAQNIGKGFALRKGSAEATRDIIVFIDSDSDIDAEHIVRYVKALGQHDMVIASKRSPHSDYKAPIMRKILSASFNILVKLLLGIKYSDTQAGLKAFRKKEFERIMRMGLVKRFAFDAELLALASLLNLRVVEAPVKIRMSARFSAKYIMYMLIDLLGVAYRLRVIKWYQHNLNGEISKYKPIIPI